MVKKLLALIAVCTVLVSCGVSKETYTTTVNTYEKRIDHLEGEYDKVSGELVRTKEELIDMNLRYAKLNDQLRQYKSLIAEYESKTNQNVTQKPDGLYYRIQLAAKSMNTGVFDPTKNYDQEMIVEEDGLYKLRIGYFKTYADAKDAELSFRSIGVKDTWIIPFNDGERISSVEAMDLESEWFE